ncbi:MAG: hypothetical protein ACTH0V_00730 [Microbacteriaceae bacterium]
MLHLIDPRLNNDGIDWPDGMPDAEKTTELETIWNLDVDVDVLGALLEPIPVSGDAIARFRAAC